MRAVRFHGRGDIRVEYVDEPECGDGEVKVVKSNLLLNTRAYLLLFIDSPGVRGNLR